MSRSSLQHGKEQVGRLTRSIPEELPRERLETREVNSELDLQVLLEFGLRLDLRKKDLLIPHDALPAHVGTAGRHQLLLEEML